MTGSVARGRARRFAHLLAWLLLVGGGTVLYVASRETWGHPIIDLGRDLWLPSQLLEGRVLYRDLLYNYGPLAPYLLALVAAGLGDALAVFEAFGLLVGLGTTVAVYGVAHRLAGLGPAFASAALFVGLSLFGSSTWGANYVLPYSYAATLSMGLALGSLFFLLRYVDEPGGRGRDLAASVLLMIAAALAKQEVGVAIALVHAVAWRVHRLPWRTVAKILLAGAFTVAAFLLLFSARSPGEHALFSENLLKFAADETSAPFFGLVAGLDRPVAHAGRALLSALRLALVLVLGAMAGALPDLVRSRSWWRLAAATAAAVGALLGAAAWGTVRLFQATPLIAAALVLYLLLRRPKDPLLLLALFTLASAPRVLLQYHPMWYGFFLVVPAYPLLAVLFGRRLPRLLGPSGGRGLFVSSVFLLVVVLVRYEIAMWQGYREKESLLVTPKGTLKDERAGRAEAIQSFLDVAAVRFETARQTLVVLPEGVSLNYFLGMRNPTAYYLFTPPEIGAPEVESRVIAELERTPPDWLVFTSRDLTEYGRTGIGIDYALRLGDWIREHYALTEIFEAGEPPYRLLLLRRVDRP